MRKSTELASLLVACAALVFSAGAFAQAAQQGQNPAAQAAGKVAPEDAVPAQQGGIQGQNIFDVKPEASEADR